MRAVSALSRNMPAERARAVSTPEAFTPASVLRMEAKRKKGRMIFTTTLESVAVASSVKTPAFRQTKPAAMAMKMMRI